MTKVFTNGCFDLIHPGHLEMIKYCASLGDHLLIGIDSDERVKKAKASYEPGNYYMKGKKVAFWKGKAHA